LESNPASKGKWLAGVNCEAFFLISIEKYTITPGVMMYLTLLVKGSKLLPWKLSLTMTT
jgi:hypothetical protein